MLLFIESINKNNSLIYDGETLTLTPVSSTNKTDRNDMNKILLKVGFNSMQRKWVPCLNQFFLTLMTGC
jgi:hypothetical protein